MAGKHRMPAAGDYWIVTTSLQQFVVRITRMSARGGWQGVIQEKRPHQLAEFVDAWDERRECTREAAGPIETLTERVLA